MKHYGDAVVRLSSANTHSYEKSKCMCIVCGDILFFLNMCRNIHLSIIADRTSHGLVS